MLGAFFDESGIHDTSKIFVISGYIAPEAEWGRVEDKWRTEFGNIVFHAADIEAKRGDFAGISDHEKVSLKSRAIDIVINSGLIGVAAGVVKEQYLSVFNTPKLLAVAGQPYEACFQDVVDRALEKSEIFVSETRKTAFIFDNQEEWEPKARRMWNKMLDLTAAQWDYRNFAVSLNFASKKKFVALQFADHLAYETYKYLHNKHYDPSRRIRVSMNRLLTRQQNYGKYLDLAGARKLYEHLRTLGEIKP